MWKTVSNIINESLQAFNVLMGSPDYAREFKKKINSAERFVNWGKESNNPLDFKEALSLIAQAPLNNATAMEKLKILQLKSVSHIGIISCKVADMERFKQRIAKKYDTDEYMDKMLNSISERMKYLQNIISVAETGDSEKLKSIMGEGKILEVRPEEIMLDARKEFESIEDNFIMKKSIKENKMNEINNFKNNLAEEIMDVQDQILTLISDMDKLDTEFDAIKKEQKDQIKDEVNLYLQVTINKLTNSGIPLKGNKGKK